MYFLKIEALKDGDLEILYTGRDLNAVYYKKDFDGILEMLELGKIKLTSWDLRMLKEAVNDDSCPERAKIYIEQYLQMDDSTD